MTAAIFAVAPGPIIGAVMIGIPSSALFAAMGRAWKRGVR